MMQKEKNILTIIVKEMLSNKVGLLLLLMFSFISCSTTKRNSKEGEINLVTQKNEQVQQILSSTYDEIKNLLNKNYAFVIKTGDINGVKTFHITIYKKSDFEWKLRDTKEVPYGFLIFNDIPVIIFGQNAHIFFKKEKEFVFFDWLKPLPKLSDEKVIIPVIFEPPIWKYEYIDKKFVFKKTEF
jgi:hypothetical protein